MAKLYRCEICGDAYVGFSPPPNCPFCGAHDEHIKEAEKAEVNFDVELTAKDRANAERALGVGAVGAHTEDLGPVPAEKDAAAPQGRTG